MRLGGVGNYPTNACYQSGHNSESTMESSSGVSLCFIHLSGTCHDQTIEKNTKDIGKMGPTRGKYRSMAARNRCLYCFGVTMVGSPLPAPPKKADSLTQLSSFLSQV